MSGPTYLPPVYHAKSQAELLRVQKFLCDCGLGCRTVYCDLTIELAKPSNPVNEELVQAAQDALQSLKRLPDRAGAWRVTCIIQLEAALAKANAKGQP